MQPFFLIKMNNEIEKRFEYTGYAILSGILKKINRRINKFGDRFGKLSNKLKFEQYKMIFGERDDDIYVATYPKSGTTLMQMILYHLTTDGNMSFKHIYEVSPWIRNASFKGEKPINLPSPRIIKTHDYYKYFKKGTKGKFIYVYRNGMDVAVSLYHQNKNYNNSNLKFEDFLKDFFKTKAWFKHTCEWFKNKRKLPVLYVKYEDLLKNKKKEINRIINFCDLKPSQEAIERAIKYSSFDYMKRNEEKFGDLPPENKKVYNQFIRNGKTGEGKNVFNNEQKELFKQNYQKLVQKYADTIYTNTF